MLQMRFEETRPIALLEAAKRINLCVFILFLILLLLIIGALPTWPYSAGWGYHSSGGFGLILLMCCWSLCALEVGAAARHLLLSSLRLPNRLLARFAGLRDRFGHDLINTSL